MLAPATAAVHIHLAHSTAVGWVVGIGRPLVAAAAAADYSEKSSLGPCFAQTAEVTWEWVGNR